MRNILLIGLIFLLTGAFWREKVLDTPDVNMPDISFSSKSELVHTCGDYLLNVDVGTVDVYSLQFIVESYTKQQQIIEIYGPPWEANWEMPCDGGLSHNYGIKALVVDRQGVYFVAAFWVFLRP